DEEECKRQIKNAAAFEKLSAQRRLYDPQLPDRLQRIDRPTLLIWGDSDKLLPPGYGTAFRKLIPASSLALINNCGHLPHVERIPETAALISRFIEETQRVQRPKW